MPNAGWNFLALGVKISLSDFCSCLPNRTKYLTKSQEGCVDVDLCDWKRVKKNCYSLPKDIKSNQLRCFVLSHIFSPYVSAKH